jgi:hypothetical protein
LCTASLFFAKALRLKERADRGGFPVWQAKSKKGHPGVKVSCLPLSSVPAGSSGIPPR